MITVLQQPNEYNWSRNDIIFRLFTDTLLTTPGLVIEVKVNFLRNDNTGSMVEVMRMPLTPNSNGQVFFNLKKVLDNLLQYELPNLATVKMCKKQSGVFSIEFRESTFSVPGTTWLTIPGLTYSFKILKGGLSEEQWIGAPNSGFFYNYIHQHRLLMTWKKSGQLIGTDEPYYLTYYHQGTGTGTSTCIFQFVLTYTDGTTDNSFSLPVPTGGFINNFYYHIPVGIAALQLDQINPAKKLQSYTVQPLIGGVNTVTAAYKFTVDYRYFYDNHAINYFSSIGGFETARVTGEIEHEINRIASTANVANDGANYFKNEVPAVMKSHGMQEKFLYKGNVGFMEDPYSQDTLRDLLMSRQHFEYRNNRWITVILTNEQTSLGARSQSIFDFPIQWEYAVVNQNYAPDGALGSIAYPSVIIPPGIALPDGYEGVFYSADYALTGTGEYEITSTTKPAWMNIEIISGLIFFSGTPSSGSAGTHIQVSFTLLDTISGVTASFTDYIDIGYMPSISVWITGETGGYRSRQYLIGGHVTPGNRFQYLHYGWIVEVAAVAGDTNTDIAIKLVAAINATTYTQWNIIGQYPGYMPTASVQAPFFGLAPFTVNTLISPNNGDVAAYPI